MGNGQWQVAASPALLWVKQSVGGRCRCPHHRAGASADCPEKAGQSGIELALDSIEHAGSTHLWQQHLLAHEGASALRRSIA
jgi:hypothetical protein